MANARKSAAPRSTEARATAVESPNVEAALDSAHYSDAEYAREVEVLKGQAEATFEEMTPAQKAVIRGMPDVFAESTKAVNAEAKRLEEARHGVPLPGVGGVATDRDGRVALDEGGRPRLKAEEESK